MLFSKLHKEKVEMSKEEEEIVSDEELEKRQKKLLRKINFKNKMKFTLIFLLAIGGLIGGYKSLFVQTSNASHEEIENQAFVTAYLDNYYMFPKTDQTTEFLQTFTSTLEVANTFSMDLEYAKISNVEIYKVEQNPTYLIALDYYVTATYETKMKNTEATSTTIYIKLSVAKNDASYLVVRPVTNTTYKRTNISDEKIVEEFKYKPESSNQTVTNEQKIDAENTINLFLKTYNDDVIQAQLLIDQKINALDVNQKLELETIQNCTFDDENIYVTTKVVERYTNVLNSTKNYYFVIDKEKNKIKTMEVY